VSGTFFLWQDRYGTVSPEKREVEKLGFIGELRASDGMKRNARNTQNGLSFRVVSYLFA